MKKQKKAALELSVTAIVVLILAIVMLGLGLGFVRGMFGKVSTSFDEQVATEPGAPPPTASERITLSRDTIITNPGENEVLKIGFYNAGASASFDPDTGVPGGEGGAFNCPPFGTNQTNAKTVGEGESEEFNTLITIATGAGITPGKSYLCNIAMGGYTKDFVVKINK